MKFLADQGNKESKTVKITSTDQKITDKSC